VDGQVVLAQKGSYIIKPRGVPHTFYNTGAETVRVMEILKSGSAFEGYFHQYEEIVSRQMSEEEHRTGRTRRTLRNNLARRTHPRGRSQLRYRFLTGVR
jgi:hypothetical protein